jgi:deazaflavin-dependent oxidoreductase (nitroreductase family)
LKDSGLPVFIATHRGRKTGAVRKTPLMRAFDDGSYILVDSMGGARNNYVWYYNMKADPNVEIRDEANVFDMRAREVSDSTEKQRLWDISVDAYLPCQE